MQHSVLGAKTPLFGRLRTYYNVTAPINRPPTGEVLGESPTAEAFRERFANGSRLDHYTDGRDLLQYISASYTTGYQVAVYDSEKSKRIVGELSDQAYESWRKATEYDTRL